jgi:uncharacterized membrane protein YkvA (DUF1232 family)
MSREAWIAIGVVAALIIVAGIFGAVRLLVRLWGTRKVLGELGTGGKVAFWGALIYTIFPIDLLPDPIYLDDMAVMGGALAIIGNMIRKRGGLKHLLPHSRGHADRVQPPSQTTHR